ncbi:MAG: MBL fold metallo-hydrolase [Lachnospiraceae bacterium]|nr:MBL fold metallo-hydrolase [Lachnospiraceae bacterium]
MKRFLLLVLLAAVLLGGCRNRNKKEPEQENNVLSEGTEMHVLSLGKADSILILADGEAMLIDAGYPEQGNQIIEYLKAQGVTKLKYVVLTHGDRDHVGGMEAVIRAFDVEKVFLSPKKEKSAEYIGMMQAISDKNIPYSVPELCSTFTLGKGVFTVLGPGEKALADGSDNDCSLVFRYVYEGRSVLLMGDALGKTEKEMREQGYEIQSEVLKVGHHGKTDATQKKFVKEVAPSYAVITCGSGDDQPAEDVLRVLQAFSVEVYRTDQRGTVVFATKGDRWEVRTER